MKKESILLVLLMAVISFTSCGGGVRSEKDDSSASDDASIPKEVTIGTQVWMSKNLNVKKFRNGDLIPEAKTKEEWQKAGLNKQPAWCYYDNNPGNGNKYGKLYNWYAVSDPRGLAPAGYHIPSESEFKELANYLGGEKIAGKKMKTTSGWKEDNHATNESGFSGLPGGNRITIGTYLDIDIYSLWWTTTEYKLDHVIFCALNYRNDYFINSSRNKGEGLSVRCIKD